MPLGGGAGRGGILQPKAKHHFRVIVTNFGIPAASISLSQQVATVDRPHASFNEVTIHSYNSTAYYPGKATWDAINLAVRDDITNSVSALVGAQEQKQFNFFDQTSPVAGSNSKFQMFIETMDGGDDGVLEQWFLEGCFLNSVSYESFDYSSADAMMITMSIRFDNATQSGGLMPTNPTLTNGVMVG